MKTKLKKLLDKFLKADKSRTINLSVVLLLFIALALLINVLQNQQNYKQYAQIVPQGVLPVYGVYATVLDSLKPGWTAEIMYGGPSVYDLQNTAPVYYPTHSLSYTVTGAWDKLALYAPAPFDISNYTFLTFYVQAGSPGQLLGINLLDANKQPVLKDPLPISTYGGMPVPGSWIVYNVPTSAFNLGGKPILGLFFQDLNGGVQNLQPPPPIYIDEINFSVQMGQDLPPPSGEQQISGPSAIPTPIMPYYPNISPWIFIIPGVIIGLAIIFQ